MINKKRTFVYYLIKFTKSDFLLRLLIMKTCHNRPYYAINKDGTRTKVFLEYFPSNPELESDGGEAEYKTKA